VVQHKFGYETIGTLLYVGIEGFIAGSKYTITEDGTGDSISIALRYGVAWTGKIKCAIYKHSDESLVLNGVTEERTITLTSSYVWYIFNFTGTKPILTSGTEYILVAWAEAVTGNPRFPYDGGDAGQGHTRTLAYDSFPDPYGSTGGSVEKFSIYCTYTVTAAGLSIPVAMHHYSQTRRTRIAD
jgi:hypothetical protein